MFRPLFTYSGILTWAAGLLLNGKTLPRLRQANGKQTEVAKNVLRIAYYVA
jgi:hypothetical protein